MVGLVLILAFALSAVVADVGTGGLIPREVQGEEKSRDGLGRHREGRERSGWQKRDGRSVPVSFLGRTSRRGVID